MKPKLSLENWHGEKKRLRKSEREISSAPIATQIKLRQDRQSNSLPPLMNFGSTMTHDGFSSDVESD